MPRIVRVGEPLRATDTDLRSGYLEGVDLRGLDLTDRAVDDLSIIECDVTGLLLPEGAGWVYIRRCTGLMRVRQRPNPVAVHREVASLYLQRAEDARLSGRRRIATIASDIGNWLLSTPRSSWVPGWAIYSDKYGARETDTAVKFVCANHPNLLEHWEWAKAEPRSTALIADQPLDLGAGNVIDAAFIQELGLGDDRYEIDRALERYIVGLPEPERPLLTWGGNTFTGGNTLRLYTPSLEPLVIRHAIKSDPLWFLGKTPAGSS